MKNFILLLYIGVLALQTPVARSQKLVVGNKIAMPKNHSSLVWYPKKPAQKQQTTYLIEFLDTQNPTSLQFFHQKLPQLKSPQIHIIVVGAGSDTGFNTLAVQNQHLYTFLYDTQGEFFEIFGVKYIPYCALVDHRGMLLWHGNLGQLSPQTITQLTQNQ